MKEKDMSKEFFQALIESNGYIYIEREVRFMKSVKDIFQIDILAVNNSFQLEIFELKIAAKKQDIGQAIFYKTKLKPSKIWLVSNSPFDFETDMLGLMYFHDSKIEIIKESPIFTQNQVPNYLHLKMSKEVHEKSKKVWAKEEFWAFNREVLKKMGYKTAKMRKFYWKYSKQIAKQRKEEIERSKYKNERKIESYFGKEEGIN